MTNLLCGLSVNSLPTPSGLGQVMQTRYRPNKVEKYHLKYIASRVKLYDKLPIFFPSTSSKKGSSNDKNKQ